MQTDLVNKLAEMAKQLTDEEHQKLLDYLAQLKENRKKENTEKNQTPNQEEK